MKSLSVKLGVILVTFVLAGCASKPQWTKPGFNPNEFKQDCYLCEKEASILASQQAGAMSSAVNPLFIYAITKKKFFNNCMEAKGYQQFKSDKERELIESSDEIDSDDKEQITKPFETKTAKDAGVSRVDWKLLNEADIGKYFYDAENITQSSENIVRVWGKIIYSQKGINEKIGQFGKKYKNLGHTFNLFEFNCVEKMSRIISTTDYSISGNVIYSSSDLKREWRFIPPETITEIFYEAVCK